MERSRAGRGSASQEIENFLDGLPIPKINTVDKDLLDAGISEEEVLGAINSLQNNKAPGPDGFPIEYFKVFAKSCCPL